MIIAVEVANHGDKFNCNACQWGRHCNDDNPESYAMIVIPGVIESRTCLLPMVTPRERFMLDLFRHYRNGVLYQAGGIMNQPAYYSEAMLIIERADAETKATRNGNH